MKSVRLNQLPSKVKKQVNLSFKNTGLLESALIHPSYRDEESIKTPHDFDRLEFFGDSILNFVICRKLYSLFPDADEGLLSRMRSILVSRKIISKIAKSIKLPRILLLGQGLDTLPMEYKTKILADAFESLIAAFFFDQGLKKTESFILKHFRPYMNARRLFRLDPNPKSTLQELSQKIWKKLPSYSHHPIANGIKVTASIGKSKKASAIGRTHRDGEEKAARLLIRKIRQAAVLRRKRVSSGKKSRKTF